MEAVYVNSNSFIVAGDRTNEFVINRRLKLNCGTDGIIYDTVVSSSYISPSTTVTVCENTLTNKLVTVLYGIVQPGEYGSFPNHSHDSNEGTGGMLSLLTLSDTPNAYENGEYLRSTISGVEWTIPESEAIVIKVKEENTSAITKGQVCAIVGSSGVKVKIGLCDCDDSDKIRNVGIAQDDITQNEDGVVVYKGALEGVNTKTTNSDVNPNGETWAAGDLLWASNIPGGLTKNRPTSGRSIKVARTVKGNSASDVLIVIAHVNAVWSTTAADEDVVLRVGDSVGTNKVSIRNYINNEVAAFDSYGNLTSSGTIELGGDLDINGKCINYGAILTVNDTYKGDIMTVTVDDASTVFGNALYCAADFHYERADADATTTMPCTCMALESGAGSKKVLLKGQICDTAWSWSAGLVYVSCTTGGLTQTKPSGAGDQVQIVGHALSSDTLFFEPQTGMVEI